MKKLTRVFKDMSKTELLESFKNLSYDLFQFRLKRKTNQEFKIADYIKAKNERRVVERMLSQIEK